MTFHVKATTQRTPYGMRVTIEDGTYLVTVSSPTAVLAWSEARERFDLMSAQRGSVAG